MLHIRADANTQIGSGHLMRCLALAQAWREGCGKVTFISACESKELRKRIIDEGFDLISIERPYPDPYDLETTLLSIDDSSIDDRWVVMDGYHFDTNYQQRIKNIGTPLMVIDDTAHLHSYVADIILNQNIDAEKLSYSCGSETRLLLGTDYVLLRDEFVAYRDWKRETPEIARKILVTLGGGDPDNRTSIVIQALDVVDIDGLEVKVVVGADNPHINILRETASKSRHKIDLIQNADNMSDLMAWADLAVSAGGSTCWELAFMGLPTVLCIVAENQENAVYSLEKEGFLSVGWIKDNRAATGIKETLGQLLYNKNLRQMIAEKGRQIVDGKGVNRVLSHLKGRTKTLVLRQVREDDCVMLWEWANEPDVRTVSFSSETIPWEQHVQWFKSKLSDPNCFFFIAINCEEVPVGQVRYDIEEDEAVISVSIDRRLRGEGYGSTIICLASHRVFDMSDVSVIHAYIKQDNKRSSQAFQKAGFRDAGSTIIHGHKAIHLTLMRDDLK